MRSYMITRYCILAAILPAIIGRSNINYKSALVGMSLIPILGFLDILVNRKFVNVDIAVVPPQWSPFLYGFLFGFSVTLAGRVGLVISYLIWYTDKKYGEALSLFSDAWWFYIVMSLLGAFSLSIQVLFKVIKKEKI